MTRILWILILCVSASLRLDAATYYIDYASGSDANNGTSTSTPWKRHPYMSGFTGSYVHAAGDQFKFKGGVAWPNACFPMFISAGGTVAAGRDYYGVDETWFTGGSWTEPVFDLEVAQTAVNNNVIHGGANHYIHIDRIIIKRFHQASGNTYGHHTMINIGEGTNWIIDGVKFTNWTHFPYVDVTDENCFDAVNMILASANVLQGNHLIANCWATGPTNEPINERASGRFEYSVSGIFSNCTLRDLQNGLGCISPNTIVRNCRIGPIYPSLESIGDCHDNAIQACGGAGRREIFNNFITNWSNIGMYMGGWANDTNIIYNNVMFSGKVDPIQVASGSGMELHIYNNTIVTTNANNVAIRLVSFGAPFARVTIQNNHYISDHSASDPVSFEAGVTLLTNNNNLKMSHATAAAQGYTKANLYSPTSLDDGSVGVGTSAHPSAFFTSDINGSLRSVPWDVGAYQFSSVPASDSIQLVESSYSVGEASGTVTVQIERLNPDSSTASITFQTVNATAVAPGDYIATNYTVAWAANVGGTTNIALAIVNDSDVEGDEFFTGFLSGVSGAAMSNPTNVTVTILDNDTSGIASATGISWKATNMTFGGGWESTNGYLRHVVASADPNSSIAKIKVTIPTTGWYAMAAKITASDDSSNSVFISWNAIPTAPQHICDTLLVAPLQRFVACLRENGTYDNNLANPMVWHLRAGDNTNYWCGREYGLQFSEVELVPYKPERSLSSSTTYRMQ